MSNQTNNPQTNFRVNKKINSRTKAPAFQFYVMDWLTDMNLRCCNPATRGLWIDLLCFMHMSEDRGKLILNGKPMEQIEIMTAIHFPERQFDECFNELLKYGILKRDEIGVYYSKRMVNDEKIRVIHAECGKRGGNPKLKKESNLDNQNNNQMSNQTGNQNSTPSSSSSSSSYINKKKVNKEKEFIQVLEWTDESGKVRDYIDLHCPNISKIKKQLLPENVDALLNQYSIEMILDVLNAMENFPNISKKYESVYLTTLNWLKRRNEKNTNNNTQFSSRTTKPNFTDVARGF